MNFLGQQIFPGPALAQNQHRGVSRRDAIRRFKSAPHLRGAPNHLTELALGRQPPPQRVILFLQGRQLQQIHHALPQFLQLEPFHQIVRRAYLQRFHRCFRRIQRRNHQHWHFVSLFAHPLQELNSVLSRQHYVEQHQIRLLSRQSLARSLRRIRLGNPLFRLQRATQSVARRRLVIHNQNRLHRLFLIPISPIHLGTFFTSLLHYDFTSLFFTGNETRNLVPRPSLTGLSQSRRP